MPPRVNGKYPGVFMSIPYNRAMLECLRNEFMSSRLGHSKLSDVIEQLTEIYAVRGDLSLLELADYAIALSPPVDLSRNELPTLIGKRFSTTDEPNRL